MRLRTKTSRSSVRGSGITKQHFFEVIEKFRNQDIWIKRNGKWMIQDFLIPDWRWT